MDSDQAEVGECVEIDRRRRPSHQRRAVLDLEPRHPFAQRVLIDEGPGVVAEIGRDRLGHPLGEETGPEDDDDRDRTDHHRDTDQTELEIVEPGLAGLDGGVGDEDVHRVSR